MKNCAIPAEIFNLSFDVVTKMNITNKAEKAQYNNEGKMEKSEDDIS